MSRFITFLKFLGLVVILNIIRYTIPLPAEMPLAATPMWQVMEKNPSYFNMNFTTLDWLTSYFYNFMMWLDFTWIYFYLHRSFKGDHIIKSLKLYGIMFLLFASISGIYMNHYSHPKDFYFWSIVDAAVVFPVVALANGLVFPRLFRKELTSASQ